MSTTYNKAKKIIEQNEELVDEFGGASDNLIIKAQNALSLKFPQDYKEFLSDYGALTFGSVEIYGVFREDFENSGVPDAIWATLDERNLINLPENLLVLYNTGLEELYCLNFDVLNSNNEPMVTSYFTGYRSDVQKHEVLYDDFSEFLLDMVSSEI